MGSWCVPVLFSQNCASHHSPWHSMREYHYRYEVFKFDTYSHTIRLMREHCHLKMTNKARVFRMIFSKFWVALETILNCQVRWICYCCIIKNARICSNNFTVYMPNSLKLIWTPLALDILRRAR